MNWTCLMICTNINIYIFLFDVTSLNTSRSLGLRRLWLALGLFTSQKEQSTTATEDKGNGGFDIMTIILWNFFNSIFAIFTKTSVDDVRYGINLLSKFHYVEQKQWWWCRIWNNFILTFCCWHFTNLTRISGGGARYETMFFSLFVVEISPISPESAVE